LSDIAEFDHAQEPAIRIANNGPSDVLGLKSARGEPVIPCVIR
jgi:hypothetical protein